MTTRRDPDSFTYLPVYLKEKQKQNVMPVVNSVVICNYMYIYE